MRVLILSSLRSKTGNNSTARRIRQELLETDIKCELAGIEQFDGTDSINQFIEEYGIDCVIGIHAWRAGSLLLGCQIPFCIVFGGTDINEHHQDENKMAVMTKTVINARYLVAFSEAMKSQAATLWPCLQEKILIQPQAISVSQSEDHTQTLKCQQMYSNLIQQDNINLNDAVIFLLIAGLRRVKDPLFLAQTISEWHKQDKRVHLVIVGPELDPEFTLETKAQVEKLPGVALMLPLDNKDLYAMIRHSFAIVNTSKSEGMATSLIEAMALGVPVLARNIPANAAIIKHGMTGFLFNNPEEFVSLAKQLIQSKSLMASIVRNAWQYVHTRHSFDEEKATYVSIIEKMK